MSSQTCIASRKLLAVHADGRECFLTLSIGQPYEVSPDEWACAVSLEGLHDGVCDVRGVDSWQAMQLAYQLIAQLLGYFVEEGGKLYWFEEREPISVVELMPQLHKGAGDVA